MTKITENLMRSLSRRAPEKAPILSLYLDLDPSQFATPEARASQLNSLLTEAHKRSDSLDLPHDQAEGLRAAIEAVRRRFAADWPAEGAGAVAVFASGDWMELVPLPEKVRPAVHINDSPWLEPLVGQFERESWVVLLVNRRTARILRGAPTELKEVDKIESLVHGRHDQGGWSQARYQRSVEKDVENHLTAVAERMHELLKREPFDCLLIVTEEDAKNAVADALPTEIQNRIIDTIDMDVENSSVDEVRARLAEVTATRDARLESEALERLAEQLGTNGRATQGLAGVLRALNEQRVEVLLYDPRATWRGAVCPACGLLAHQVMNCPVDDTKMVEREDLLEDMIERAISQSAEVRAIKHHLLQADDSIAALTRY